MHHLRILKYVSITMINRKTILAHLTNKEDRSGRNKECNKYEDVERTESNNRNWTISVFCSKSAIQEDDRENSDTTCVANNLALVIHSSVVVITYLSAFCHGPDSCQPFSGP